jgi:hypothetical protein
MQLYIDGLLNADVEFSGSIASTNIDLTIGQMVPGNIEWNFAGLIDDVRIYNRVLAASEIADLVGISTAIENLDPELPHRYSLSPPYPNPFGETTTIPFALGETSYFSLEIFDVAGRRVRDLDQGEAQSGEHLRVWDGRDDSGMPAATGVYIVRLQTASSTLYRKVIRL